jgi:hypothetical protein
MQKRQNCRPVALLQDAGECVITGSRLVQACHIIPQAFGDEEYHRICGGMSRNEPANLVLLTHTLHAAFDDFMFSFAPTGRGTYAVEVYVSDPELDLHEGKIVRLAAGDMQLAAHRAKCACVGRRVGSQERDLNLDGDIRLMAQVFHAVCSQKRDEDLDSDAGSIFSAAYEDIHPTIRPQILAAVDPVENIPRSAVDIALDITRASLDETTKRSLIIIKAFHLSENIMGLIAKTGKCLGIHLTMPPKYYGYDIMQDRLQDG